MTFRMIVQLWNTNTSAFVSCDADLTENYMYISMKFGTGVHVFCWEVGVFNRSSFQSVSYKIVIEEVLWSIRGSYQTTDLILYTKPWLYYRTRPFTEFWEVSIKNKFAKGVACRCNDGDAYSSEHLVQSHLGTCMCFTCWNQSFFRTCRYFSVLCTSNVPRYFLDFAC